MVNPGKVVKARKSKRTSLHDKHKVERKVREFNRKQRRDGKRNPQKHKKKDPGIPNSWPFKQQMLQEQELQREKDIDSLQLARETRKKERAVRRAQEAELQKAMKQNAQQRRQGRRQRASFAPLPDVLSEADVVLVVLDARDPAACRCAALERALIDCEKLPILVLNKIDLVPRAAAEGWLATLRRSLPTVPFCCAAAMHPNQSDKTASNPKKKARAAPATAAEDAATAAGADALAAGGEALAALLAARAPPDGSELNVGLVGFDRVGKRALLRALGKCDLGPAVKLLPMTARLHPVCETPGVNDVLLRTCAPSALPQPELLVGQVLSRCDRRALLRHFQVADFSTDAEFLRHYAARAAEAAVAATGGSDAADGGGTAAAEAAAAAAGVAGAAARRRAATDVLRHWSVGEMSFFAPPPAPPAAKAAKAAATLLATVGDPAEWGAADARVLALSGAVAGVEVASGVPDEIDLTLEDDAWEGGEEGEEGEESEEGEEGEEMEDED